MRINGIIIVFSVIGVILVTWRLRTRDMDFMTPTNAVLPPEDFGDDLAVGKPVMQPKIVDEPKIDLPTQPTEPEEPVVSEISDVDLGDLQSAPGLDEYRSFAQEGSAARLLGLSSMLQARGDFQRAMISLERVIDSSPEPTPLEISQATTGIATLSPTLPPWNVDPNSETELILLISSSKIVSEEIKNAALDVATLIRKHSGDQLRIVPKMRRSGSSSVPHSAPLAISFQRGNNASTATLMMRTDGENISEDFIKAVFRSVRGHLANEGYPFPKEFELPAQDLLTLHITRLMWQDFAKSIVPIEVEEHSEAE